MQQKLISAVEKPRTHEVEWPLNAKCLLIEERTGRSHRMWLILGRGQCGSITIVVLCGLIALRAIKSCNFKVDQIVPKFFQTKRQRRVDRDRSLIDTRKVLHFL